MMTFYCGRELLPPRAPIASGMALASCYTTQAMVAEI
jgi:hypothetical protein